MKKFIGLLALTLAAAMMLTGCKSEYKHYGDEKYDYQFAEPAKGDVMAKFHTTMGDFTVHLFRKEAPKAVQNFTELAKQGYYDGQNFFRIVSDYYIQSGDPTETTCGGDSIWGKPFENEIVPYLAPYYGALCMANSGPDTNTSQFFFITRTDNDTFDYQRWNLDVDKAYQVDEGKLKKYKEVGGAMYMDYQLSLIKSKIYPDTYTQYVHTVFGQVIEGLDVLDAIGSVPVVGEKEITEAEILYGKDQTVAVEYTPFEDITINSIEIYEYQ